MSLFVKLMIGGWTTTFAMFGLFALNESGKLLKIRRRVALWLEPSLRVPAQGMQPERERA